MKRHTPARDGAAGFSVAELMLSSAVLLTVLISTMNVVGFASTTSARAASRDRAVNIAGTVIERARNMPFDQVGVRYAGGGYGEPAGEIVTPDTASYPGFTVTTVISWARSGGRAAYKQMKVTVSWQGVAPGDVSLETGIFGATELVNVGDLKVTVVDRGTGAPIVGALVTVDPFDIAPPRMLNALGDGVAYFGRVDQGPAVLTVSAAGFVFDNTLTMAVPINKDLVTEQIVFGYRASSLTVTIHDPSGPVTGATATLTDSKGGVLTAKTDASGGGVIFANLYPGVYSLDASIGGRRADRSSVEIKTGGQALARDVLLPAALPPGQLRLTVRDARNPATMLSGVTVSLLDAQGVAAAGSPTATVAGQTSWAALDPGTYTASAALTGYTTGTGTVIVVSAQPNDYAIKLVPTGVVTGTIRAVVNDARGKRVVGRVVYLSYGDGYQESAKTDSNGTAEWGGLPITSYRLWISTPAEPPQSATPGNPYTVLTFLDN